jgi:hypothetical protein
MPGLFADAEALGQVELTLRGVREVTFTQSELTIETTVGNEPNLGRFLDVVVGRRKTTVQTVAFQRRNAPVTSANRLGAERRGVGGVRFNASHSA